MTSKKQTNGNPSNYTVPLQINGAEIITDTTFDVVDPATGSTVWKCSSASIEHARDAAQAAQAAFPAWAKKNPTARRDILLKAADILERRRDELLEYLKLETAVHDYFAHVTLAFSAALLRHVASNTVAETGFVPVCAEGRSAVVIQEPYGVVLGIAPWNAPYPLGLRAVASALAAGNTTILKGSERSPRCYWAIGSVFQEAGLPDGCLNVVEHRPQDAADVTTALIEHPSVKKISFTGSAAVGRIVAATAGRNLKPILLELGGKASAIVLPDADIKLAAEQCAAGALLHSGQICMSTERILVHSSIIQPFSTALKAAIEHHYPSHGPGPILVMPAIVKKNRELIDQAVSRGATLLVGDLDTKETSQTRMRPVVLENVKKDMNIYHEESFGPSVSLFTIESEDEAIALANDTEYGLSAAVFTKDLIAGLRIARQIESGAVHINSMTVHDEPTLPHGGVKNSGFGRFHFRRGLDEFTRSKTITWMD